MEQYFYTVQGKQYVIRTVSKRKDINLVADATSGVPRVFINCNIQGFDPNLKFTDIGINTSKGIIPIMCSLSVLNATGTTVVDITSCYSNLSRGDLPFFPTPNFDNLRSFMKNIPLFDIVYFTNNNLYGHNFRYGQSVYDDADFMYPQGGMMLQFEPDLATAINNPGFATGINQISIPATGSYSTLITFTYFEQL